MIVAVFHLASLLFWSTLWLAVNLLGFPFTISAYLRGRREGIKAGVKAAEERKGMHIIHINTSLCEHLHVHIDGCCQQVQGSIVCETIDDYNTLIEALIESRDVLASAVPGTTPKTDVPHVFKKAFDEDKPE